jgi:hypothetical protein
VTDLLTHVLVAYALAALAARRTDRLDARHVPLATVGAVVPDAAKLHLLLGDTTTLFGTELSWYALQTVGGIATLVGLCALAVERAERRAAALALTGGAAVHLVLDLGVTRVDGRAPPYLYPLTWWEVPSPGLYLSADPWPSLVALALAGAVAVAPRLSRRRPRT